MRRTIATVIATLVIAVPATALAAGHLFQLRRGDSAHIVGTNIYCSNFHGRARCKKIRPTGLVPVGSYRVVEGTHRVRVAKRTRVGWTLKFQALQ
jgi:hypothetical protein